MEPPFPDKLIDPRRWILDLLDEWRQIRPPRQDDSPSAYSIMLKGYANALFNLGQRYERGSGVIRNAAEACRCYVKSARLGNLRALTQLAAWLPEESAESRPAASAPASPDAGNQ